MDIRNEKMFEIRILRVRLSGFFLELVMLESHYLRIVRGIRSFQMMRESLGEKYIMERILGNSVIKEELLLLSKMILQQTSYYTLKIKDGHGRNTHFQIENSQSKISLLFLPIQVESS